MQSLVSLKTQLQDSKSQAEQSLKQQEAENTKLEKELVEAKVQTRREQLVKELNTMRSVKKSDAIINQAMKDQEAAVQKEVADLMKNG